MESLGLGTGRALSADHTFRLAMAVGDHDFAGLFTVWNGDGMPIVQFFVEDLSVESIREPLQHLQERIKRLYPDE